MKEGKQDGSDELMKERRMERHDRHYACSECSAGAERKPTPQLGPVSSQLMQ